MTPFESTARASTPSRHSPAAGVTHVRHRHTTHFTVIGNHLAQHPTLSSTAIGIAVRIQSLPDGTRVGIRALAERLPESEYKIAAALKELEAAGYLRRSRERTAGQRIVTRTTYYECPDTERRPERPARPARPTRPGHRTQPTHSTHPQPVDNPAPPTHPPAAPPTPTPSPPESPPASPPPPSRERTPAADLLAGLRRSDARLALSVREITQLTPAVETWLARGVPAEQVSRTLTATLPGGIIVRASALLAHRLTEWLPPVLPSAPPAKAAAPPPAPFQECPHCERVFRSPSPGRCRDCRPPAGTEGRGGTDPGCT
ncbi:hypothetical protein EYS09_29735 [Streptomyces kasugaensis]|uniref:Helix-turn-helix domain-containing protein n=1 Tax=Streptomyces kasugaensis TaxID=1946 RepID=A0A4V2JHV8_STRKA|nr:hypothetical protein EYS09_29735 [Streptomyces kasugaensis]